MFLSLSLETPCITVWRYQKEESEDVSKKDRMATRKRTIGQAMIYNTLHIELNIEQDQPHSNREWSQVFRKGEEFMLN
jgi:hypothetical protein